MDGKVLEFGSSLLDAGDLDPVYNYLHEQNFSSSKLKRWLMAYSMFYHCGVAEYLSEFDKSDFWHEVYAGLKEFPRGEERRHFRGKAAWKAVNYLSDFWPESLIDSFYKEKDFVSVSKAVQRLPLYGPWIAFKMADIGERVLDKKIDFSNCALGIYKEPRAGAALVLRGEENANINDWELEQVVRYITDVLNGKGYMAPPTFDRPLNVQEAETILCKYKSHLHGHYPVGKDINAVQKALAWHV